jgi:hypothetical protein
MFFRNKNAGEVMLFFTLCNTNFLGVCDIFISFFGLFFVVVVFSVAKNQMKHYCLRGVEVSSEFST